MADDGDVIIDGKPISSLRVVDLKKECDKRGLQKSGSKVQLIERLKTQLLLENLGKDSDASGPQLQEDECQNEFIKQYLAQQKQLIVEHAESSMNSSSQESDTDDSPVKQRPVDQSPPMKSPPVEISPEKLAILSEKPVQEVGRPENKKKTEPVQIKKLVPSTEVADKKAEEEPLKADKLVPSREPAEDKVHEEEENHPTKSQSEGAVFEEMGRTKKRISRLDSGSKSQTDIPESKPATRQSRRSRNSSSVGSEQDHKDVEKDIPVEAELVKQAPKHAESKHKLEQHLVDKENKDKDMETEEATNGKHSGVKPDTEQEECEETHKIVRTQVKAASPKRHKSSSRSRSRSPAAEKKHLLQAQSSTKRPTCSSSTSSSSSSSRSRSREKHKTRKSSSSSSSRSRSRSQERTPKNTVLRKLGRQASRSSSSSRSRSRSPSPKRPKKQEQRHLAKAPEEIEKPPAEQRSTEMQSEMLVSQRSPSRSSSSRSGSSSPVRHDQVNTTAPVEKAPDAARKEQVTKQGIAALISDKTESAQSDVKPTKKISLNRKNIEDAGKVKEEGQGDGDKPGEVGEKPADGGDKPSEEKPAKKRRWGSHSTSTSQKPKKASSLPISTESLKGLIPDIKPALKLAPEPVLEDEMDYEDDTVTTEAVATEHEDTRSVKIQRTVTQDVNKERESDDDDKDDDESESEEEKEKQEGKQESSPEEDAEQQEDKREIKAQPDNTEEGTKNKESPVKEESTVKKTITVTTKVKKEKRDKNKEIKLVRRLDSGASALIQPDEPLKPRHSPSPARNPVSKIIHIRNLVRPFTVNQLKELLKRSGNLIEEQFWIDKIKSHCFAVYETEEEAEAARKALHNTTWPLSNPKTLTVDFGSEEQMDYYRGDQKPIPPPGKKEKTAARDKDQKEREERQKQLLEEREKEAQRRRIEREKRMKEREEREERNRPKPVREWDKDKKSREDWDRTLQKSRSRSPRERKRSMSGSPSKERRGQREDSQDRMARRERRKVPEKKEDEPPAKLLDDLFKKTKTTPCIYWLPLTEAQIAEKEKLGFERPVLRQKQKGDGVSPIRETTEGDRSISRMRQTSSPSASRRIPQEGMRERSRGRRESPGGRRQPGSPGPRSRSDGRRR